MYSVFELKGIDFWINFDSTTWLLMNWASNEEQHVCMQRENSQ